MTQQPHKVREPLFRIAKRDTIVWWKAWCIRAAAIIIAINSANIIGDTKNITRKPYPKFEFGSLITKFIIAYTISPARNSPVTTE